MEDISILLREAKEAGASDLHISVGVPPKMRIHGTLVTMNGDRITPQSSKDIARQIMNEKQWDVFAENGELDMSFSIQGLGRFRVNAYRQRGSVALALRLVGTVVPTTEELGIPESVVELYRKKKGLILVAGDAGSGKSTTLAGIIDKINTNREAHVITLEDPIEYLHKHKKSVVNQREIGLDSKSYASALRAALREDPDVILVGEMRDAETMSAAMNAAETGHLVLASLHASGVVSILEHVMEAFPLHQQQRVRVQLANVLEAVISQQLIPTADGNGRVAAFEVMHNNSATKSLIREGNTYQLSEVMRSNRELGMITMDEAILRLLQEGRITVEMAIQFAKEPEMII